MNLKTFTCPICGKTEKLQLSSKQKIRRCEHCSRLIRVLPAGKRKKRKLDVQA